MTYKAYCGKSTNTNGEPLLADTVHEHEKHCQECIKLMRQVDEWAMSIIILNEFGNVIKIANAIKILKLQFGISTMNAQRAINKARKSRLKFQNS